MGPVHCLPLRILGAHMRIPCARWLVCTLMVGALPAGAALAGAPRSAALAPARTTVLDIQRRVDVNNLNLFVTNFGSWGYDLSWGSSGLIYPKGSGKSVLFDAGIWLGAIVQGEVRTVVAEYSQEFAPGVVLPNGLPDDPSNPAHRVYKVARWTGDPQDTSHVERIVDPYDLARPDPLVHHSWSEYMAGAAPYGAPWRLYRLPRPGVPGDSLDVPGPDVRGDQMLWSVYNDADPAWHNAGPGSSSPLDVQIQQTTWAFNRSGALGNTVFLEFRITHPQILAPPAGTAFGDPLEDLYVSLWADPDVGGSTDDLVGCDIARSLGYAYNATNSDAIYGTAPPALGFDLLRGPTRPFEVPPELPMTAFDKYINGTDPASTAQAYFYMQGLNADGSPVVDPTTGQPTRFFHSGDPVTGTGWLDLNSSDKRMMVSAGPITMAPGDVQTVTLAVVVGQATNRLGSISLMRVFDDQVQSFFDTSVAPPDTMPPLPADACPRPADFWADQCPGGLGGALTAVELDSIAARVDRMSRFFTWPGGAAGFCEAIQPSGALDVRQQARQEFATLLANVASGPLDIRDANGLPVFLSPSVSIACTGVPARTVSELLALPDPGGPRLWAADYLDLDAAHGVALAGVDTGLGGFGGGAGTGWDFFGSSLDPAAMPDSFSSVELRFSHIVTQKAYRFLRLEQEGSGASPPQGRSYLYGGFHEVPFTCWDTDHGVQLDVAFVERTLTDAAGTILPAIQQPATLDSTWGPDASSGGGREYLFVIRRPYDGTAQPSIALDGSIYEGLLPVLYALWARSTAEGAVIDDGDRFRFRWGVPPDTTFESLLATLEGQSLGDPAVAARYGQILDCLAPLNRGIGVGQTCDLATPVLLSLVSAQASPDRVELTWSAASGFAARVERSEGGEWTALADVTADGTGMLRYVDRAVTPGRRYGYRLASGAMPMGETWVDVPAAASLSLAGLLPNPGTRGASVVFTLPRRAPARLELIDVAGRIVLSREVGQLGAGAHTLQLDAERALPAGLYFIRLAQGTQSITTRGVLLR